MKYYLVTAEDEDKLNFAVNDRLRKGWRLHGGAGFNSNKRIYFQAMIWIEP